MKKMYGIIVGIVLAVFTIITMVFCFGHGRNNQMADDFRLAGLFGNLSKSNSFG